MAVMNPAFPTVVNRMPNCCRLLAAARTTPQQMPPVRSVFLSPRSFFISSSLMPLFLFQLSIRKITGSRTTLPTMHRTELKVKGPT